MDVLAIPVAFYIIPITWNRRANAILFDRRSGAIGCGDDAPARGQSIFETLEGFARTTDAYYGRAVAVGRSTLFGSHTEFTIQTSVRCGDNGRGTTIALICNSRVGHAKRALLTDRANEGNYLGVSAMAPGTAELTSKQCARFGQYHHRHFCQSIRGAFA